MAIGGVYDLWYKNAIFYAIDVETYQDSNGDGVGDFPGLTQRLEHISSLGISCIWLLPFYVSPNRDDGYDIADYYQIDPRYGDLGDFVAFVKKAEEVGIRVIVDLVVNHTSDQHPWFRQAVADKSSRYRDYYIWSKEIPGDESPMIVFPGEQDSNWTYNEEVGEYYRHIFYSSEPDLNTANPAVCDEIYKIIGFWLRLGISGFRVDAAPFIAKSRNVPPQDATDPHIFLRDLRNYVTMCRGDAMLLAEANVPPDQLPLFFGDANTMHMLFNFVMNDYLLLALAEQSAEPVKQGLRALPQMPDICAWANFLRIHDELSITNLSDEGKRKVFDTFAPEENMRIYGRGIRRRIPPMLGGRRDAMELAYSLMFSLPGAPVLLYGEEIGMGDNLSLPGRISARIPMQWSGAPNGGFSSAPPEELTRPVVSEGPYRYEKVNVEEEIRDTESFLRWMQHLVRLRRSTTEIGYGEIKVHDAGDDRVLAHSYSSAGNTVLFVHNLSEKPRTLSLDLPLPEGAPVQQIFGDRSYESGDGVPLEVELEAYSYRWFRIEGVTI